MLFNRQSRIYLDYAAATPVDSRVIQAMQPYFSNHFGNPSALHTSGIEAKKAVEDARKTIGTILGCHADEILFTSSGTESNNLALLGLAHAHKSRGNHIIISSIEHSSILSAAEALEKEGFVVTRLPVDEQGIVTLEQLKKSVNDKTILISLMYANNEIGTIQPIREVTRFIKETYPDILIHSDVCQAPGQLSCSVNQLGLDACTINGSKVYGPKGIGLLYLKKGTAIMPNIYGGGQEHGIRGGTENVPSIVGFALALRLAEQERKHEAKRLTVLRDEFIKHVEEEVPGAVLTGHRKHRLPNNAHFTIDEINGETLVLYLNKVGIEAATGAACTTKSIEPSHVLQALGFSKKEAFSAIRFTLGRTTTRDDIHQTIKRLKEAVDTIASLA